MASAKYSAGLNASAAFATGADANIRIRTPTIAAASEAPADNPMATLALPCWAIG